ncbi:MAG: UDP-3-O-(3-hydroxymyristoyl)glucosamine N-acyltransferase [Thermodesulfovibrionales bacterium]|nr:UDP-3-O-(3-hydroxymyristoyl)glucosamine N-acyltransferase [Thermodesulfovibrionales bacterium]
MKLKEIAEYLKGELRGEPELEIRGVEGIEDAMEGDITFLRGEKLPDGIELKAGAIIVKDFLEGLSISQIRVKNPQYAFARLLELFYVKKHEFRGVSKEAFIEEGVELGKNISIYPFAYVSRGARIGDNTIIGPHVFIGENSTIGKDCLIYPNVVIREGVSVGNRVIIHSGTVIGSDGFGYVFEDGRHYKIPQVGGVIIEDDVEIGANVTIDRATKGNTVIMKGTKIDNLVQIAHNVKIGPQCIIVAQTGIAGSSKLGAGVILAGQVGVADHIKIGDGVRIGAQSGIMEDIPSGTYFGTPTLPHREWFRLYALYKRLPELFQKIKELEEKIKNLEGRKEHD